MMRAVAIDDIEKNHVVLTNMLDMIGAEVELVGTAADVAEGVAMVDDLEPDLLFLDVELPDGDGFDILQQVTYRQFITIFVTGKNEYAVRAFEFAALDYLEKPLHGKRLRQALERAGSQFNLLVAAEQTEELKLASQNFRNKSLPSRLKVANTKGVYFIPVASITHLETEDDLITIVQEDGKRVHKAGRLKRFVELLEDYGYFMQVHKSAIVNLKQVEMLKSNQYVVLNNGEEVMISTRLAPRIRQRLERL